MFRLYKKLNIEAKEFVFNKNINKVSMLYSNQRANRDYILTDIAKILLRYTILDNIMNLSNSEINKLKQELNEKISKLSKDEYEKEKLLVEEIIYSTTNESYLIKQYLFSLGIKGVEPSKTKSQLMKSILNETLDNKKYYNRILKNKVKLEVDLKKLISNFLEGKTSVNSINKEINNVYSKNAFNTKRLVNTEIARVQARVDEEFFKEHNIKKVMYLATLDKKTCNDCTDYDGVIFDINETRPKIPRHPLCRCCYVEMIDDWKPINRRDNTIVDEHIDFTNYENWKKEL